jgi:hypothetical protein
MKYLSLIVPGPNGADVPVAAPPGVLGNGDIIGHFPQFIITLLIGFVMVAAIVMIIASGIQWTTSGGDAKKIEGARARLTYAIIGLIIAVAAVFIVGTTIKLLGGNPSLFNIGNFNTPPPKLLGPGGLIN